MRSDIARTPLCRIDKAAVRLCWIAVEQIMCRDNLSGIGHSGRSMRLIIYVDELNSIILMHVHFNWVVALQLAETRTRMRLEIKVHVDLDQTMRDRLVIVLGRGWTLGRGCRSDEKSQNESRRHQRRSDFVHRRLLTLNRVLVVRRAMFSESRRLTCQLRGAALVFDGERGGQTLSPRNDFEGGAIRRAAGAGPHRAADERIRVAAFAQNGGDVGPRNFRE